MPWNWNELSEFLNDYLKEYFMLADFEQTILIFFEYFFFAWFYGEKLKFNLQSDLHLSMKCWFMKSSTGKDHCFI